MSHRIIVYRTWHRDDGSMIRPHPVTGLPTRGTIRWNADCVTHCEALGSYETEAQARRATCGHVPLTPPPMTGLPSRVAEVRRLWLAGLPAAEIAAVTGLSVRTVRYYGVGDRPARYRLDDDQRRIVRALRAEAKRITTNEETHP